MTIEFIRRSLSNLLSKFPLVLFFFLISVRFSNHSHSFSFSLAHHIKFVNLVKIRKIVSSNRKSLNMKPVIASLLLVTLIILCSGVSQPIIPRAEGCIDRVCGSHCAWDGVKIVPGDNLNKP